MEKDGTAVNSLSLCSKYGIACVYKTPEGYCLRTEGCMFSEQYKMTPNNDLSLIAHKLDRIIELLEKNIQGEKKQ